ncbi:MULTISPECIES: hypothetical protein [unclassified Bradyrhizobium]|uniref:hypothetical protein n=1 Tax=unclassified Bradyrhizobium TaxID=2631580 RepID=UPI0029161439|nr:MULTISPECIES: hypothetical protein [unclassified Bradyrhizobium]
MLASLLWTLAGLLGAGGMLGVAAMFVPTVAVVLKSALDFLRSPLGEALGLLALVALLWAGGWIAGDMHGAGEVRAAWRADIALRTAAEAKREADLREEMARVAGNGAAFDLSFSNSIDQKVQTYVAKTPAVDCRRATRGDIERLLSIK